MLAWFLELCVFLMLVYLIKRKFALFVGNERDIERINLFLFLEMVEMME